MIKEQILSHLKEEFGQQLDNAKKNYETTKNLVQQGDLKSDGKYDTRATEANYLADGQRGRVTELEQELELLDSVNLNLEPTKASIGSLIELELNEKVQKYFIAPTAGGKMINIDGEVILVISVFSPIGDAVLSLEAGDEFEIELPNGTRSYLLKSIK